MKAVIWTDRVGQGWLPKREREMAELILSARKGEYHDLSRNWPAKFEKRQSKVRKRWTKTMEKARAQRMIPEKVEEEFDICNGSG